MKILFLAPYVPSPIRVRPYSFIRQLSTRHQVTVLAVGSDRDADAVANLRQVCHAVEIVPLTPAARLPALAMAAVHGEPLQSAVCHAPVLVDRLRALLETTRFDVAHIEHLRAARLHSELPSQLPSVFDSVDSISLLLERTLASSHSARQRWIARLELKRTRAYEARLLRNFDRVVITSSEDAAEMWRLDSTVDLTVIPNGVDLERFRPLQAPTDPATLVFSGKMSYHANVSAVLHFVRDILPLVRASHPSVRLRIVGSHPPAAVQALTRDTAITVTGYVPDMREALAGATVAICPVTVKVGIQNKVLEAMALGLPVVCSQLGAEGIDARSGRDFLVARDPPAFAELIGQVLSDPGLAARIGSSGRRYVESTHRWDVAAQRLEAVYAAAIEDHHYARAAMPNWKGPRS